MQKWPSLRFYFSQNVQHWECFVLSSDYSRRAPLMPSDSGGQGCGWLGHYKYPVSVQGVSWRRTDDPVWTWRCHLSVIKSPVSHKHSIRSPTVSCIGASCNYSQSQRKLAGLVCDSQTIIELKVFGLCEADTLHSVMRAPEELEEEGKGGGGVSNDFLFL